MEIFYLVVFFVIGTFFGSFYNVVGHRLPRGESIFFPASHCESCGHRLSFLDMIPLLSYFFNRGRCRYCKEKLSFIYPLAEFGTGLLFAVAYYSFGFTTTLPIALTLVSLFVIILVSDLSYFIIPDEVLVVGSVFLILFSILDLGVTRTLLQVLNGLFLFGVMYGLMWLGNKLFHKESLGGGDVKLMFVVGLLLHPILGLFVIFLGSFLALPVSIVLYHKNKEHMIPFGPFLCLATLLLYFLKVDPNFFITLLGF